MKIGKINKINFPAILEIYTEGLKTGLASFETALPSWEKWNHSHVDYGRITISENGNILGWAALSPVSNRCVYGGVAEVSVYVSSEARNKGIGVQLLNELIRISEENEIWTLQSSIFKENIASKRLHLRCGFREIGYKEKIGILHGKWYDNVLLERRSAIVGI